MFGLFRRKPVVAFSRPANRWLFRFWDGAQYRAVDPLLTTRLLYEANPDIDEDTATISGDASQAVDHAERSSAIGRAADAVRTAFEVEPFQEQGGVSRGLTDAECLELLGLFAANIGALKKKYQFHADLAAVYGAAVLGEIDEEMRVGLYLNRDRQQLRRANEIAVGVAAALGANKTASWFQAQCDDDFAAGIEFARYEANRQLDELDSMVEQEEG